MILKKLPSDLRDRAAAVQVLEIILTQQVFLDQAIDQTLTTKHNIAEIKRLVRTTLKRRGQLDSVLSQHIHKALPRKAQALYFILLIAACEICFLNHAPYGVVNSMIKLVKKDHALRPLSGLTNAVLRKLSPIASTGKEGRINTPEWFADYLDQDYGTQQANAIMNAHLETAPVDLTLKNSGVGLENIDGLQLSKQTFRLTQRVILGNIPAYNKGLFWVQDAAAALPVRMFGNISGLKCLDVAAAPGGKTMQLAASGADVTAIDISKSRLEKLQDNLVRTGLSAKIICHNLFQWSPETADTLFDCILLDAPCSATGTLRRHPDLVHLQDEESFAEHLQELVALQRNMFAAVWPWLKSGGRLVYATCSLLKEEGEEQAAHFLDTYTDIEVVPQDPEKLPFITSAGHLRTTPADLDTVGHQDGFFAVCFQKS